MMEKVMEIPKQDTVNTEMTETQGINHKWKILLKLKTEQAWTKTKLKLNETD